MKLVHIIPNLKKGGAERLVLDICNELKQRDGIEVKITFDSEGNIDINFENIDTYQTVKLILFSSIKDITVVFW